MKRTAFCLLALVGLALVAGACQGGFPTIGLGNRLVVTLTQGNPGTPDQQLPISVVTPTPFTVSIEADLPDGTIDSSFNGYVNILVQPGTVSDLDVRNVQLQNGSIAGVVVPVLAAFGETHIWADDLGYEPAAPNSIPPPQCSDGIDNNHNGLIDYPADPGCYAPVDNTEDLGTYASGASDTIYFQLPRIQLVRGYDPVNNGNGNATSFPNTQVSIDTGWRGGTTYAFSTVVIGLGSAGFYAQDLQTDEQPAPGYGGIYAYNFSTPVDMRVCDRLQVFSGTSADFYGYTELNYPTWQLEYWDPTVRPCLVPEATVLGVLDLNNDDRLWQLESTLARIETAGTVTVQIAAHFGAGDVPYTGTGSSAIYTPTNIASNCDYDHNGKINFDDGQDTPSEANCAAVCVGSGDVAPTDYQCSEYSAFASESDFIFIVSDKQNTCTGQSDCANGYVCTPFGMVSNCFAESRIQADGSAADLFDPVANRGQTVTSFTGIVSYFSGGSEFTLNARCDDDIAVIPPPGQPCPSGQTCQPLTSNVACVQARTQSAINANSP
jgi:hypothetical protein